MQVERNRGVHRELTSTSKATGELGILAESNNEHELLVLHGMVNGVHVSCLVDSGATHNFSSDLIAKAGCTTSCESDGLCINLADGRKTQGSKNLLSNTCQCGSKRKVLVAKLAVKLKFQSPN